MHKHFLSLLVLSVLVVLGGTFFQPPESVTAQQVPSLTISASPNPINPGTSTTITWSSVNTLFCNASGDWSGSKATSGTETTGNLSVNKNFILTCTAPTGEQITASAFVVIIGSPSTLPAQTTSQPPTVSLSASNTSIPYNSTVTLNWSSTNATSCTSSGDWSGIKNISGSETTINLTSSRNFVMTCLSSSGVPATSNVVVTVAPPPAPTMTFTAVNQSVAYNGTATLNWGSTNTTSCIASGDWLGVKGTSGSFVTPALTSSKTYTLTCFGQGGQVGNFVNINVGAPPIATGPSAPAAVTPPPTVTFTASPTSIAYNSASTLTWSSTNATSCKSSGGNWSPVTKTTSGSESTGAVIANRLYVLTCTGPGGDTTVSTNVTVGAAPPAPAPVVTIGSTLTPGQTLTYNTSTTLTWSSQNTTSCTASGGWLGVKALNGSEQTPNLTESKTYTITCTGAGGTVSKFVSVSVGNPPSSTPLPPPPPVTPPPTVTFTATPASIAYNGSTQLSWSVTNSTLSTPTSCKSSGGNWSIGATKQIPSGNETITAITANKIYVLTCSGPGGDTTVSTNVTVGAAPAVNSPTVTISANPKNINYNNSSTITWSSTNASSCTASGDWSGARATSGTEGTGNITSSKSYTLICTGQGGQAGGFVTVVVAPQGQAPQTLASQTPLPPPPKITFTATPAYVAYNNSAVLTWSADNATSCTSSGGNWALANKPSSGTESTGSLKSSKVYVITCSGQGGDTTASANVSVSAPPPATVTETTQATTAPQDQSFSGQLQSFLSKLLGNQQPSSTSAPGGVAVSQSPTISGQTIPGQRITPDSPKLIFIADPPNITAGKPVTIVWSSINTDSCAASGDWSGDKGVEGRFTTENLSSSKNFILTCSGPGGQISSFLNVNFENSPPPTMTFSASPSTVTYGKPIALAWSTNNALSCTASGSWSGEKALFGAELSENVTTGKNFVLTCKGPGGEVERSINIENPPKSAVPSKKVVAPVKAVSSTQSAKTTIPKSRVSASAVSSSATTPAKEENTQVALSLDYTLSKSNGKDVVIIKWEGANVKTCIASGEWFGARPVKGTENVGKPISGKTYTLSCTGKESLIRSIKIK